MNSSIEIFRTALIGGASVIAVWSSAFAGEPTNFDIEAGELQKALNTYIDQSGEQLIYRVDQVRGATTKGVEGRFEPDDALDFLLDDTGFDARWDQSGAAVVVKTAFVQKRSGESNGVLRLAQLVQDDTSTIEQSDSEEEIPQTEERDVIIVTGSNIKGVSDQFSPSTSISRDDIDFQGLQNVEDIVNTLPQNFGGSVSLDNSGGDGNVNGSGSTGINLRGLGVESTLVLINGRRVAAGGNRGNFVDVSTIPVAAIDRVEVVADGASAIYGSDAVAGVVNFILRDDYNGAETQVGYDVVTDGGAGTLRLSQTAGFASDRANGMISYQYSKADALDATDKEFAPNDPGPNFLTPESEIHSVFASGGVNLSDALLLSADFYYNNRNSEQSNAVQFGPNVFETRSVVEAEQIGATGSLQYDISKAWSAEVTGTYSRSDLVSDAFSFFFDGTINRPSTYKNISADAVINGELPSLSDEPSRIAVGGHYRTEDVDRFIFFASPVFGDMLTEQTDQKREVAAIFGELYSPIVTESDGIPGIERLAVTVALRHEDYDDVGSSTDPRFGLLWSPVEGLTFRGTYGTSFRAPSIFQVNDDYEAFVLNYLDPTTGTAVPAVELRGSTSDLNPEESESWSAGFDWKPPQIEGLELSATYFSVDYEGRLGRASSIVNPAGQFDAFTGMPIRNAAPGLVQSLLDGATQVIQLGPLLVPPQGAIPVGDITVVLERRLTNLAAAKISGIDMSASYSTPVGSGILRTFINGTFLDTFEEQLATTLPVENQLDTYFQPNGVRIRGGLQWSNSKLSAGVFANHTGDYVDDRANDLVPIDSWTTFDASFQLNLGELIDSGILDGTRLTVSMRNIANEDPPEIVMLPFDPTFFDATNADPYGRRVGFTLTKEW